MSKKEIQDKTAEREKHRREIQRPRDELRRSECHGTSNMRSEATIDQFERLFELGEPHNISGINLNKGERLALLLGPNFIPAKEVTKELLEKSKAAILEGLEVYFRRIHRRCYFSTCPEQPIPDFIVKRPTDSAPWLCPDVIDEPLRRYMKETRAKFEAEIWPRLESKKYKVPNALPTHIRNGLRDLKNNTNIKMDAVDKGGGLVVVTPEWDHTESLSHLKTPGHYMIVTDPPTPEQLLLKLKTLIEQHGRLWRTTEEDGKMKNHAAYMLQAITFKTVDQLRYCFFYLTVKMHKDPISTRPICSNLGYPLYFASKYVHKRLFKIVQKLPTYIADSKHFMILLEHLRNDNPLHIFAADIDSMYPNIPITMEAMAKIRVVIIRFAHAAGFNLDDLNFIIDLLWFILNNMYLEYKGDVYLQTHGTAMGTALAVCFACIYVAYFELQILDNWPADIPRLAFLVRYIDDYAAGAEDEEALDYFTTKFNDIIKEATLFIKVARGRPSIDFLDLNITSQPKGIWLFKTFRKPTRKNNYLLFSSDHPIHVKTGLIKTEINRFRQNSSADADFEAELTTLRAELIARQYPPHFVQAVFNVHMPSRRTLLYPEPSAPAPPPPPPTMTNTTATATARPRPKQANPLLMIVEYNAVTESLPFHQLLDPTTTGANSNFCAYLFGSGLSVVQPIKAFTSGYNLRRQLTNRKDGAVHVEDPSPYRKRKRRTKQPIEIGPDQAMLDEAIHPFDLDHDAEEDLTEEDPRRWLELYLEEEDKEINPQRWLEIYLSEQEQRNPLIEDLY